jgi:hypothetical protein
MTNAYPQLMAGGRGAGVEGHYRLISHHSLSLLLVRPAASLHPPVGASHWPLPKTDRNYSTDYITKPELQYSYKIALTSIQDIQNRALTSVKV